MTNSLFLGFILLSYDNFDDEQHKHEKLNFAHFFKPWPSMHYLQTTRSWGPEVGGWVILFASLDIHTCQISKYKTQIQKYNKRKYKKYK